MSSHTVLESVSMLMAQPAKREKTMLTIPVEILIGKVETGAVVHEQIYGSVHKLVGDVTASVQVALFGRRRGDAVWSRYG